MATESVLKPAPDARPSDEVVSAESAKIISRSHFSLVFLITLGLSFFGYWASSTELDIVTRGSGQVVPTLQNQFVQHLEGGIVEEILVAEGQVVRAGETLMRITDDFSQAEFKRASQELNAERAKLARLDAESMGLKEIKFAGDFQNQGSTVTTDQAELFERRRRNIDQRILVLQDQIRRKELEKREKEAKLENTQREFEIMNERVKNLGALVKSGATSKNEVLKNQLELQKIKTRMSDLAFQIPQIDVEISEARQRQNEVQSEFVANANEQKIDSLNKISLLRATMEAMQDRESRTDVRAPIDGKVHRLFQTTIGGVVQGGQNLVQLVPIEATVSIEIALSPKDRGRVWTDLPAVVKLSAYDFSIYGGIQARVTNISSDTLSNGNGEPFYRVNLEADTNSFDGREIVPGMAAEVDIITGRRLIIDYLLSPIKDVQRNALREH
ncbi:MAG: HlyD family type I secretion periplasmic adaptor subunit [Pseudomonadota bacterium]